MLIRENIGFYAGQVREFPSHIGLELMRNGRGENPFVEHVPALQSGEDNLLFKAQEPVNTAPKPTGRKRR